MGKNDDAWEILFAKYNILDLVNKKGYFDISSDKIKKYREPRLMAKFDWRESQPRIFRDNGLSILPIASREYRIAKFDAYQDLVTKPAKPRLMRIPSYLKTFDKANINSESVALNVAEATGMIDDVMDTKGNAFRAASTITGKISSGTFNFQINNYQGVSTSVQVNDTQIEIDACYENSKKVAVVEAKIGKNIHDTFIIRQLYFPYRVLNEKSGGKEIVPIFFTYVDEIFSFYLFKFKDVNNYSSIVPVEQMDFTLNSNLAVGMSKVIDISTNSLILEEEGVYPQANNFGKVLDVLKRLKFYKTKERIAADNGFNERQSSYYGDALIYLGFAEKIQGEYLLTDLGEKISTMENDNTRNPIVIKQILAHVTFKRIFDEFVANDYEFNNEFSLNILRKYLPKMSSSTINRRISTVHSWIRWIISVS